MLKAVNKNTLDNSILKNDHKNYTKLQKLCEMKKVKNETNLKKKQMY